MEFKIAAIKELADGSSVALVQIYQSQERSRDESFVDIQHEEHEHEFMGEIITYTVDVPFLQTRTVKYSLNIPVTGLHEVPIPKGENSDKMVKAFVENGDNFLDCPECGRMLPATSTICPRCKHSFK